MNTLRTNRRSLGIGYSSRGEPEILVWAPYAKEAVLVLTDRDERIPLSKGERGYFSFIGASVRPGDRYVFELDGRPYPDPVSQFQPQGIFGPSEVVNLNSFNWTDHAWNNPALAEYVIYELHTGTFSPAGTFSGIEEKLSHLNDLGATAIEIMPVAEFSGKRNWGYDGVFPFAVHHAYGGPVGLQRLVDKCHSHGIAVILDVVYNHLGPEGNYLNYFGPYFTDKYKTPWGSSVNFDDAGSDEVRRYFLENLLMWFRDFHIDALRLDAVHAIRDFGPVHILAEMRDYTDDLMKETGRTHYLIAECDLNDPRYITDLSNKGYGMDAQWIDEFHHALRVTTGNERRGYYEDFNGIVHLAKSYRDAYVYDGQYSEHRQKTFGSKANGIPGERFIVFSQNHDQVGNRMLGERTSTLVSFEMQKLMAAAVLISPFLPMLFMGEEYGETNPFQYFVDHSDRQLVEAVRVGRKNEFRHFHQGEEVPDPQSEETFNKSKLQWSLVTQEPHSKLLLFYKTMIAFRKQLPALSRSGRNRLSVNIGPGEQMLVISRQEKEQRVVCLLNFSDREQPISDLLDKNLRLLINSSDVKWGGPSMGPAVEWPAVIPKQCFMLFINQRV